MKSVLFGLALCLSTMASAQTSANVLIEQIVRIGFAAPGSLGTFRFQVLTDGTLQSINNKQQITVHAHLDPAALGQLVVAAERVQFAGLTTEDGPSCLGAPSTTISLHQFSGKEVTLFQNVECQKSMIDDPVGASLVRIIFKLNQSFQMINNMKDLDSKSY